MNECIDYLNYIIQKCEIHDFMTIDVELQRTSCSSLWQVIEQCGDLKAQAIADQKEDFANVLLGFECVAKSLIETLNMWISLKGGNPDQAWDHLINAQSAATYAARADNHFSHLLGRAEKLESLEAILFPPQVFLSAGLIVHHQKCSICGSEYGECEHLAGKPYWGSFCALIAKDIEVNHVAIVESPSDKRCRITQFTDKDGSRDQMTRKLSPPDLSNSENMPAPDTSNGEAHLMAQARIIHTGS